MKIWRVENENGMGCYYHQPTETILKRHKNINTHPTPRADKGINRPQRKEEVSGFISQIQAMKWFSREELELLAKIGYLLVEVDVEVVTDRSLKQVLAIRKNNQMTISDRLFSNYCC